MSAKTSWGGGNLSGSHDLNVSREDISAEEMRVLFFFLERTVFRGVPTVRLTQKEIAKLTGMDEGNLSRTLRALAAANVYGVDEEGCYYLVPTSLWRLRPRFRWTREHDDLLAEIDGRPLSAGNAPWLLAPVVGLEHELAKTILPAPIVRSDGRSRSPALGDVSSAESGIGRPGTGDGTDGGARDPNSRPRRIGLVDGAKAGDSGLSAQAPPVTPVVYSTTQPARPDAGTGVVYSTSPPSRPVNIGPNAPTSKVVEKTTASRARSIDLDLFDPEVRTDRIGDRSKATAEHRARLVDRLAMGEMRHVAIEVTGGVKHMTEMFRRLLRENPDELVKIVDECATNQTIRKRAPWMNTHMAVALGLRPLPEEKP